MIAKALTKVLPDTNLRIMVTTRKANSCQEVEEKIRDTNPYARLEIAAKEVLVDQELNQEVPEVVPRQTGNLWMIQITV